MSEEMDLTTENRLSKLETAVESLDGRIDNFIKEMRGWQSGILQAQRTPWGIILGAMSITITMVSLILGSFMSGYIRDQDRIEETLKQVIEYNRQHEKTDGHSAMAQRVGALEKAVTNLDTTIQREMRLLDAEQEEKIEGLRREMVLRDGQ